MAYVTFTAVTDDANQVYAFIAYAHLDGVVGVGYFIHDTTTSSICCSHCSRYGFTNSCVSHNYDLNNSGPLGPA